MVPDGVWVAGPNRYAGSSPVTPTYFGKINCNGLQHGLENRWYRNVWGSTPQSSAIFLKTICIFVFVGYSIQSAHSLVG